MVRAIVHETASLVFDLSPRAIEGKYAEKKGEELLLATVFKVAKEFQPSVVYIDECEKVFPGKKKGKKKKGKKSDPNSPARLKKAILSYKKSFLNEEARIVVIGCSSEPTEGNLKDMKSFFDKKIYFPYPNYSTRRLMWKNFIESCGGFIKPVFPLSTLAHISEGYTSGSVYFLSITLSDKANMREGANQSQEKNCNICLLINSLKIHH